jgi:hypothetical protein
MKVYYYFTKFLPYILLLLLSACNALDETKLEDCDPIIEDLQIGLTTPLHKWPDSRAWRA